MPHPSVKTIRDLIYWEYAKLISGSAVSVCNQQLHPSDILRENKLLVEKSRECAYCGVTEGLEWEHIIPTSRGGPDTIDNQVLACRKCNSSKGNKCLYEWYGEDGKYNIPRLVWGKYLKIIYDMHKAAGTLERSCSKTGDLDCILE